MQVGKIKVIETITTTVDGKDATSVNELLMWPIDAREAMRNDPARYRVADPEKVADNSSEGLREQLAALQAQIDAMKAPAKK